MPPPRLHVDLPMVPGASLGLPDGAARHVQVLRLQPGASLTLFDGRGGEIAATIEAIGRRDVTVRLGQRSAVERELPIAVTLALGMPANERMDALVEKATELGVATIQPLLCERSVLRLAGERAQRRVAHWQAVALAACEQSGRTRVPEIAPVRPLADWLEALPRDAAPRWVLGFGSEACAVSAMPAAGAALRCLSGPEGGLAPAEQALARAAGFTTVTLGPRVLRADTAPLAVLAYLALRGT